MGQQKILIVEDDEDLRAFVAGLLGAAGYHVLEAANAAEAHSKARETRPDLMLLDLILPDGDGLAVFRKMREEALTVDLPVIVVSARTKDRDIVQALELGAEDYVSKPFNANILLARVRRVLRRSEPPETGEAARLEVGPIALDPGRFEASIDSEPVRLTAGEFRALQLFMERSGQVFTRSQIIESLRGPDTYVSERSVDVLIAALRRKLHPHAHLLQTVHGVGYRFHPTADELREQ